MKHVICCGVVCVVHATPQPSSFFFNRSFNRGSPVRADGSGAAEVCKRRDPKGSGRVGPEQHPPPYGAPTCSPREPSLFGSSDDGGGCQGGGFQRGRARRGEGWRGACLCPCFAGRAGVKSCRRVCGRILPASPEASAILCLSSSRCHSRSFSLGWHLLWTSFRSVMVTAV